MRITPERHDGRSLTARRRRLVAPAALVLLVATGCASADMPTFGLPADQGRNATDQTQRIISLWQGSWIAALLTGALIWGLILYCVAFFRKRRNDDSLPPQVRYNLPIEVIYTIVPIVMVLVFFFFTARDESRIRRLSDSPEDYDHVVEVVGFQWSWQFNYQEPDGTQVASETGTPGVPPTLYLPEGERIRFKLTSQDVIHSFWVPAFLFKMDVFPNRVNQFEITPEQTGTYVGRCAEMCGLDHARMLFNVKVVSPAEYDRITAQLAEANS